MENIRYRHDTLVGGYSFYFFPVLAFFCCWKNEKNFVGSGIKIRVGRVTGNQQLFFLGLIVINHEDEEDLPLKFLLTFFPLSVLDPVCHHRSVLSDVVFKRLRKTNQQPMIITITQEIFFNCNASDIVVTFVNTLQLNTR
jgi:hypothetical protein